MNRISPDHTPTHSASDLLSTRDDPFARPSLRVLVVDDVELTRKMYMKLLRYANCECTAAVDGQDAVNKVRAQIETGYSFDLVLTDYEMPTLNGPDSVRQMRAVGYVGKVVGVTGHADTTHAMHFLRCGVNRVMVKPVKRPQLLSLLNMECDTEWAVENVDVG